MESNPRKMGEMFLHEIRACLEKVAETVRKNNGSENREREREGWNRVRSLKGDMRLCF